MHSHSAATCSGGTAKLACVHASIGLVVPMLVLVFVLVFVLVAAAEEPVVVARVPLLLAALEGVRVDTHRDAVQKDHLSTVVGRDEHVQHHRRAHEEVRRTSDRKSTRLNSSHSS